jgi:hippurate hydrolase
VRKLINDGVTTTARAAAMMAGAPEPEVKHMFGAAPVINDIALSDTMSGIMKTALGDDNVTLVPAYKPGGNASEDYSEFVAAGLKKSVYFGIGGYDPKMIADYKAQGKPLPVNHSPYFAPVPEPAIRTGVRVLTLAVLDVAGK